MIDLEKIKILKEMSILYAEDDLAIQRNFSYLVKDVFKEVYLAENGQDGFKIFQEKKPSIVLIDIHMPIMDGFIMAKEIRKIDKKIPLIVISAYNESDKLAEAKSIGINDFLIKPLNLKKFINVLTELV